jgi:hypothetical protein
MSAGLRAAMVCCIVLIAGACGPRDAADPEPAPVVRRNDVEYTARTALLASYPVRLRTTITARSHASREVVLRPADDCPVLVIVLSRDGRPRWNQAGAVPCDGAPREVRLPAADSVTFETELTAPEILGDSLPDDVYLLVAHFRPAGAAPIVLQAGRANLVAPPGTRDR